MKKRLTTLAMALIFALSQLVLGFSVKAEENNYSVEVLINSYDKVLAEGTSIKSNAYEALKEVADKNNLQLDPNNTKYVSQIGGVDSNPDRFSQYPYDGWMYAVYSNGKYEFPSTSLDETVLKNGDKLILYYGDYQATKILNKLSFSTLLPDKKLEITLQNEAFDWNTNKNVVSDITDAKVNIDGKEYVVDGNKVTIGSGLPAGQHILEVTGWRDNDVPSVVHDKIKFELKVPEANVRVEGLSGTIAEGKENGSTVLEMLDKLLKDNKVDYHVASSDWGKYVDNIAGIKSGDFGNNSGWMVYYKSSTGIDFLPTGMDTYEPKDGENYIIYYGDYSKTSFVNSMTFTPGVVKENESFKIKFSNKYYDYSSKENKEKSIANVIVTIDGTNYITDSNGEINVTGGLSKGDHTYRISGYNVSDVPTVVMDKGIFTIDNVNSPSLNFDPAEYEERDNTSIKKDIDTEIESLKSYISSNSDDPWASLVLAKYGIKGGETYINQMSDYIKENGLSECTTTDLEKLILNLTALGYSPYNFMGNDLVAEVFNRNEDTLLINDAIFGLLTYNYANIGNGYKLTKDKLIKFVLDKKLSYDADGKHFEGWAISGDRINPDITGAALSALSPYNNDKYPLVKKAISKAVDSLSMLQDESGYLPDNFGKFSESLSFAIIGLVSVGENPEGVKFTKSKGDLVSALLSFKGSDGQFKHSLDDTNDYMATEQTLRVLYSLREYKKSGKYDFYNSSIDAKKLPKHDYLPQTGSFIDSSVLIGIAVILIGAGVYLLRKREIGDK